MKSVNNEKSKAALERKIAAQQQADAGEKSPKTGRLEKWPKLDRKWALRLMGGAAIVIVFGFGYFAATKPRQGSAAYGLCRTFLELQVAFPQTLQIGMVESFSDSVRIWHTQIDGFGSYRNEPIQCYFRPDDKLGLVMTKVVWNRRSVDAQIIEAFNRSLFVFQAYAPDRTLPYNLPNQLKDLKVESGLFQRRLF